MKIEMNEIHSFLSPRKASTYKERMNINNINYTILSFFLYIGSAIVNSANPTVDYNGKLVNCNCIWYLMKNMKFAFLQIDGTCIVIIDSTNKSLNFRGLVPGESLII